MWADIIVIVQQVLPPPSGEIKSQATQSVAELVVGQRLEAVINKAVTAGDVITLKVGDKLLELATTIALKPGQVVQLELISQEGKLLLKLLSANEIQAAAKASQPLVKASNNDIALTELKPGQKLNVEVVKILADNRLLVQTQTTDSKSTIKSQQFDIDVSKLTNRQQVGDNLRMNIISVKPLTIQFEPQSQLTRQQLILDKIQQLTAKPASNIALNNVSKLIHKPLPEALKTAIQALVTHSIDKSQLRQQSLFKQALASSGFEMEKKLLQQPDQIKQDFKANISKVLVAVESMISEGKNKLDGSAINKLPAQISTALSTNGQTRAQLVKTLLSGTQLSATSQPLLTTSIAAINSHQQASNLVQLLNAPLSFVGQQTAVKPSAQNMMNLTELSQLFKEVDGIHTKLQLNQLMMLKEPETVNNTTTTSWLFDLPIKDKQQLEMVQLHIDRHKGKNGQDDDNEVWNVKLRLDTQNLGAVQATLTLDQHDVKIVLRAQRSQSAQLLADDLAVLDQALIKLGVSMSHSSCHCGDLAESSIVKNTASTTASGKTVSMVDVSV